MDCFGEVNLTGGGIGSRRGLHKYDFDMWVSAMLMGAPIDPV
jgi:hypothetical protein